MIKSISPSTRNLVLFVLMTAFLSVTDPIAIACSTDCVQPSENAAELVEMVLEKRLESRDNPHTSPAARELGNLLFELRESEAPEADEALCALFTFYLGEANDGDVLYQVTFRGRRLTPMLEKYRSAVPCVPQAFEPLLHREETRHMLLDLALGAIKKGEVIGVD